MELSDNAIQPYKAGTDTFDLPAGDTLKIESDEVEHLNIEVPAGKTYRVIININIREI